jgi:hypothetical protein
MERLNQTLPQGIEITEAEEVPLAFSSPPFPRGSVYWIPLDHLLTKGEVTSNIKKALDKGEFLLHQERKGKKRSVDIRPLIEKMEVKEKKENAGRSSFWGVELTLRGGMGRTAKPSEIIGAILGLEGETLVQCKVIKLE